MVTTAPTPRIVRTDVWHGRYGPALALVLIVIPFAIALLWALSLRSADPRTLGASLYETAELVETHGEAMVRIGERVTAAARASSGPESGGWVAYGQHMTADGRALADLADRLRDTAAVVGSDPTKTRSADVNLLLQARWEHLRSDGIATAAHGRIMVDQARIMADAGLRLGFVSAADVAEIDGASQGMVAAGTRTVEIARALLGSVDLMRRWMGR